MGGVYAAQLITKVGTEGVEESVRQLDTMGKKVDESKGHFEGLKHALSTAAGFAIFGGVTAGVGVIKDQIGSVIDLTKEYQQTEAQTAQVLKSTHDVSGMTAESLDKLAEAYGKTTMFSSDTVKGGENLLLTFTNIGHQVFPQATQAILDVSQAMGQDLKSSAIQVGKALGDPTTGMTALQRIGVTFSEQEKKTVKEMMAHNDIIGAQKIILHELSTEFGGSAAAAGKTFGGQMAILNNQFDEMKIKIGGALLPVLSDLMNKYIVPLAGRFQDWMNKGGGLQDFQNWIKTASNFLQGQLIPSLKTILNQYIIPLGQAFYDLFIKSGFTQNTLSEIGKIAQDMAPILGGIVSGVTGLMEGLSKGGPGAEIAKDALIGIGIAIAGYKGAQGLVDLNKGIGNVITSAGKMKQSFTDFISWFGDTFLSKFKSTTGTASKETESIGAASKTAEGEVATASGEMDAELGGVGVAGEGAATETETIGPAAQAAEGEVATASTGMKASLASVMASAIPLAALIGNIEQFQNQQAHPFTSSDLGTNIKNSILNGIFPVGGVGDIGANIKNLQGHANNNPSWVTHAHASGIFNSPTGHMASLGEQGDEWMHIPNPTVGYVPQGASVLPHGMSPSVLGGGSSSSQPIILVMDGRQVGHGLMPHIVNNIRNATGVRF